MSAGIDAAQWLAQGGALLNMADRIAMGLAERLRPAAPRICSFMVANRMVLVRADQVVRLDDMGNSQTAILLVGSNSSFPILVDGDLSEVARKLWGDAWSAGAASEGPREGGA